MPIDFLVWFGLLSGVTTPGQNGPGSDGNKGVLRIPQNSSITRVLPSDCLVTHPEHLLGGGLTPLQRCSLCILQLQLTGLHNNSEDHRNLLKKKENYF